MIAKNLLILIYNGLKNKQNEILEHLGFFTPFFTGYVDFI